jgi:hypothetical protein
LVPIPLESQMTICFSLIFGYCWHCASILKLSVDEQCRSLLKVSCRLQE